MPSPRSNRTTAMRPSGPWPFSIVTKSATVRAPRTLFPATIPHKRDLSRVGKKDFHDLVHPWIEGRYLEGLLQRRCRTGILTHGFVIFDARPLGAHRYLLAVDAAMQACRDKAFVMADIVLADIGQ